MQSPGGPGTGGKGREVGVAQWGGRARLLSPSGDTAPGGCASLSDLRGGQWEGGRRSPGSAGGCQGPVPVLSLAAVVRVAACEGVDRQRRRSGGFRSGVRCQRSSVG